jgi:methionyl-tRNA synthetase
MSGKKVLVTSALPYVNNVPHLGNIVGCVLPGDVYSRYMRAIGRDVMYICGADEYGTSTEIKAYEERLTPREVCDKYIVVHKQVYDWFQIEFDYFGRTSTADPWKDLDWKHTKISQDIFIKLADRDLLIEKEMEQLYCNELSTFVSDRFVQGKCPKCSYQKARGDQCDSCGQLLNAIEIIDPVYKLNPTYHLEIRKTTHLFLDLPKLQPVLQRWVDDRSVNWDKTSVSVTRAWLDAGLEPRCITRDLKWGTPVPDTKKFGNAFANKIMYNWFDAPIGYISITANYVPDWESWWKNPDEVELVNMLGEDNIVFHTLIFPATLIGTGDNYTLLNRISAVKYLTYEGGKFSKTEGTGIFGNDAIETGISSDVWRFYLMIQRPEFKTTEFSWLDLQAKVNGELNDNLGNLFHRVISFAYKRFDKKVPVSDGNLTDDDVKLISDVEKLTNSYHSLMANCSLRDALHTILEIGRITNKYAVVSEPWNKFKTDKQRCATSLNIMLHIIGHISYLLRPFMPTSSAKLDGMLGFKEVSKDLHINKYDGYDLALPEVLFSKITDDSIELFKKRFG